MSLEQLVAENDPGLYISEAISEVLRMLEMRSGAQRENNSRISRLLSTLTSSFRRRHNSPKEKMRKFLNEWKSLQPQIKSGRSEQIATIANGIMVDTVEQGGLLGKADRAAEAIAPGLANFAAVMVHIGLKKMIW